MSISSPGIGSNLDVNGIVSKLMTIESQPLTDLNQKEASYQAKLTAYGSLRGALSTFQSSVSALNDPTKFKSLTTSVGDSTILTASAGSSATAGTHSIQVNTLAQAQAMRTNFTAANVTDAVGTGTLTFYSGTYDSVANTFTPNTSTGAQTVTIDAAHNSLSGIRDAINGANIGITASIINDGTTNRLVLSANNTGAANSIKIAVSDNDGNNTDMSGLSQLAYDPTAVAGSGKNMVQTLAAQDATLSVDGISITKSSNTISDAIQGVTLNLLKPNSSTSMTVSQDTGTITSAVQSFVNAYNTLQKTFGGLMSYDPTTKQAGLLQGDSVVRMIQSNIQSVLGKSIMTLDGSQMNLVNIGVSFQKDGTLALDTTKLQNAISSNPNNVMGLFAATGMPSDSLVQYLSSTSSTQAGEYGLSISTLATQGNTVGSAAAGLTITAGSNDSLTLTVDNVTATVSLAAGTYTADSLLAEVQSKINGASAFSSAGVSVAVSHDVSGVFTITSNRYGSASNVTVTGNGASNLLGATPTSTAGVDVGGTMGGMSATGSGQTLTGNAGGANGLAVKVLGGATGLRGSVVYSQGFASQLDQLMTNLLGSNGPLTGATNSINSIVTDIGKQRDALNTRLSAIQARYMAQYTALDTMISQMTATQSSLTQELASLPKLN